MYLHGARNGNFSSHNVTFGGALVRNDVVAVLDVNENAQGAAAGKLGGDTAKPIEPGK